MNISGNKLADRPANLAMKINTYGNELPLLDFIRAGTLVFFQKQEILIGI